MNMKLSLRANGLIMGAGVSLLALSACTSNPTVKYSNGVPNWIAGAVSEGLVCSQDRGIYSKTKAENLAIEACLIQLSDKKILGAAQVSKETQVNRINDHEKVTSQVKLEQQYQVTTAEGQSQLAYDILGKYYDLRQEKVYVWLKLK